MSTSPISSPFDFATAVSADLRTLQELLGVRPMSGELLEVYMRARLHYLAGDTQALEEIWQGTQGDVPAWMSALIEVRVKIRRREKLSNEETVLQILQSCEQKWLGEAQMVLAIYFEDQARSREAADAYSRSAKIFFSLGLIAKAFTAEYNALIAQSHSEPSRRYLVAYHHFVERSREAGLSTLAGVALANLAREYQLLGFLELAIEHSGDAVELLRQKDFGTLHYYLTVAQLLDARLQAARFEKVTVLYEELASSPHREVTEIVRVMDAVAKRRKSGSLESVDSREGRDLPRPWLERYMQPSAPLGTSDRPARTEQESEILRLLLKSPLSLVELAQHLNGDRIDAQSSLARTKQAIYRLRKKLPQMIIRRKGRYEVVD